MSEYMNYENMEGKFLPANVGILAKQMAQYSRNRFRLESVSADSASAGRIISVNLPESALLDLKSFRFHFDATTNSVGVGGDQVFGKLPNDAGTALIQRCEVNINGISVAQGAEQYNSVWAMKKLEEGSLDRSNSVDRCLIKNNVSTDDAVDSESLVVSDWVGFLGEQSTRFLPTDLVGQVQVRLTLAPNAVLIPKQSGVLLSAAKPLSTAAAVANAKDISYSVNNIYFTVDSVSLAPIYNEMMRDRLEMEQYIPINYKEYYTFNLDSITSGSSTTRFSLSSGSIDKMYGAYRDSNYQSAGVPAKSLTDAAGAGQFLANYLRFRGYNNVFNLAGNLRWNWSTNNVLQPQYQADFMDALCDVNYAPDKVGIGGQGTYITSKDSFNDGKFVLTNILNHPTGLGCGVQSGFNSRGINTMMTLQVRGQTIPTADPDPADPAVGNGTQQTGVIGSFVVVETTAQLRAGLGKSLSVLW